MFWGTQVPKQQLGGTIVRIQPRCIVYINIRIIYIYMCVHYCFYIMYIYIHILFRSRCISLFSTCTVSLSISSPTCFRDSHGFPMPRHAIPALLLGSAPKIMGCSHEFRHHVMINWLVYVYISLSNLIYIHHVLLKYDMYK